MTPDSLTQRARVPPGRWPEPRAGAPGLTLPELWAGHWATNPSAPVLVDGWDAASVMDGAQLAECTARVAAALAARGVGAGDRVLWCARSNLESVAALLGVLRAGAVLVTLSPSAAGTEVAHVVADAGPALAVTDRPDRARAFGSDVAVLGVHELAAAAERTGAGPTGTRQPEDDALIVYTSGTTGKPKGAVHTHSSLLAGVTSLLAAWAWTPEDRLVLCLPLFHVHGLCAGLFGTLAAGASATVFDRFDEAAVLGAAPASTMFFGVPTMYHRLAASRGARELASLRLCVSGSAPLAPDLWRRLAADGVTVLERYGMTETLLTLSNPVEGERRPGSVGVPLPGVEAAVDVPDDVGVGELMVRAPSLCRGYWARNEAFAPGGWFATGDLVSMADDGYVTVRGRRTDLIITGGHNVYPAEVEAVLLRHPEVSEVAVVGLPSAEWGETVVAFVVGDPDPGSLDQLAAAELAPYKRPREVRLVDALPRNALGKVVRSELR
jgi:malonyl-CoA/methylmalonyl-CoA synthetase